LEPINSHNEIPKLKIDVQSFLQTIALLLTIIGYAFYQNDRLTTLETQDKSYVSIQADIVSTEKTLVALFNAHLVDTAGRNKEFEYLRERIREIEVRLKLKSQLTETR